MTALHVAAALPVSVANLTDPQLPLGAQPQMLIKQPAMQLAGADQQPILQLTVREAGRLLPRQPRKLFIKQLSRAGKPGRKSPNRKVPLTSSPSRRSRQDFIHRRIKFARTGVKIGDHAATFRGRRWYEHADLRHPSYASSAPPPNPKRPSRTQAQGNHRPDPAPTPSITSKHGHPDVPRREPHPLPFERYTGYGYSKF